VSEQEVKMFSSQGHASNPVKRQEGAGSVTFFEFLRLNF
jgi:hypothetical protein